MHHLFIRARQRYRVGFVPDPCWTVVPVSYQALARQRARWAQIMAEALWIHRGMLFNPRYGVMGLFILPCYLIFELGGAIVEVLGLAASPPGWCWASWPLAWPCCSSSAGSATPRC